MSATAKELSRRLETVRDEAGLSLRAFWQRMVGGEEGDEAFEWHGEEDPSRPAVGYRTVTRYHRGEREAPVDYLARVSEVFGVRIRWLVTGGGPPSKRTPQWLPHPAIRELEERGFWDEMSPSGSGIVRSSLAMSTKMAFLELLGLYEVHPERQRRHKTGQGPGQLGRGFHDRADDLRFLLRLPLEAWGFGHVDAPPNYWRSLVDALYPTIHELLEGGETRGELYIDALRKIVAGPAPD